jgi:hypothetical protein
VPLNTKPAFEFQVITNCGNHSVSDISFDWRKVRSNESEGMSINPKRELRARPSIHNADFVFCSFHKINFVILPVQVPFPHYIPFPWRRVDGTGGVPPSSIQIVRMDRHDTNQKVSLASD